MNNENNQSTNSSTVIEDLTLNETTTDQVKGGATDFLLEIDGIKGESSTIVPPRNLR